jgi:hypothetical protein
MVTRKVANGDDNSAPKKTAKRTAKRKPSDEKLSVLALIPEGTDTRSARDNRLRAPNPWPPAEVTVLLICACLAPLAKPVLEGIKLWVDRNNGKKIKIKHGDTEIEIQGGISEKKIISTFSKFRRLVKDLREDNIKVIAPPGTDLTLPIKPDDEKRRRL